MPPPHSSPFFAMNRLIVGLPILIRLSSACVASGTCGLGPCLSPIPPVTPPCQSSGCAAGFSCGTYGCYRVKSKVHAAGIYQLPDSRPIIYGASRFAQFRRPKQVDPNALFMQCCEQRGLPDACLSKCSFNSYTKETLTRMYFRQDACPLAASAEIQFCAAQGRDHRACCTRNGVTTTMAGDKCLTFCDQRPGNVTLLDYSYISCYDRFDNMKACFWQDASQRTI